ncbi:hypothetical protein N658DRAFT_174327 [Parathielavia hyrcaniae]|uniref:Uncharacterized protein n=1 Tax=Parathielavia hyrcaniae TaxID=113614 RepID=A0AAN6T041_9PEZI|nr:hypothetical protein N658DRAFT_174327 [Parathielavia hyrcaniae]
MLNKLSIDFWQAGFGATGTGDWPRNVLALDDRPRPATTGRVRRREGAACVVRVSASYFCLSQSAANMLLDRAGKGQVVCAPDLRLTFLEQLPSFTPFSSLHPKPMFIAWFKLGFISADLAPDFPFIAAQIPLPTQASQLRTPGCSNAVVEALRGAIGQSDLGAFHPPARLGSFDSHLLGAGVNTTLRVVPLLIRVRTSESGDTGHFVNTYFVPRCSDAAQPADATVHVCSTTTVRPGNRKLKTGTKLTTRSLGEGGRDHPSMLAKSGYY